MMRSQAATCSTSAPTLASRSRSAAKTVPSSSSIPTEATERTDYFQSTARFHGFTPSFALLGEPETNGVVERFHRTLKEQIIHGRSYKNLAQLRAAVATFVPIYNHHWRLEKLRYQSPVEARIAFQSTMPLAA
jgi:transposase InsO family protein